MPSHPDRTNNPHLSRSQIEYLLNNLPSSLIAVAFGVAALVIVFRDVIDPVVLYSWTAAAILITLSRLGTYLWLKKHKHYDLHLAERLIFISATATGLLWGVATILFCIPTDMFYWVFMAFFMSGYASGAVFSTSALLPACAGYFFPTILPVTAWMFLQEDSRAALMGVLLLSFTFAAWNMARNAHRFLIENVEVQTQLQLAQQEVEANQEKVQALQTMAGGIAHDFNNILAGMTGNLYLARNQTDVSPKLTRYLSSMEESLSQASNIGRKMLAYSNAAPMNRQHIQIEQVLQQRVSHMQHDEGMDITCHVEGDLPPLHVDVTQFEAVLDSLIFNAHESYGASTGTVKITAGPGHHTASQTQVLPANVDDKQIYITVSDTGCGMSPEIQAHIFDPFFTTKFTGRGLGMSVVYGVIQRMGGAIAIQSSPGQGTNVSISLPAA